jgi:hypothetical protein
LRSIVLFPLLSAWGAACVPAGAGREAQTNLEILTSNGTKAHIMPKKGSQFTQTAAPSGAHLQYFGGPVLSNAHVVQVLYGSGTYISQVTGPNMGNFYGQVLNSPYVDWLSEYNTGSQTIGRGTYGGQVQITPSSANSGSSLSDSQIQSELNAQISAGHLPLPNDNTVYMVNFPAGSSINLQGTPSCQAGGFCAYHSTFTHGSQDVFYGVLPDMSPGSGCDQGCGSNSATFDNQSEVASHEMVEAITDCAIGLATGQGAPMAWYDPNNGEIGDICGGQGGSIVGSDGVTYAVQAEFSNSENNCIVTNPNVSVDAGVPDTGIHPDATAQPDAGGGSCSHPTCSTGSHLTSGCDPCVTQICTQDSYCCSTLWDNVCVGEVSSICGQSCGGGGPDAGLPDTGVSSDAGTGGACSHPICTTGKKLTKSCNSCANEICTADPYCCAIKWDSVCVGEVGSICGQPCS